MIPLPQLSISSERGQIGIRTEPGRYEIQSRPAELQVESTPGYFTANNRSGTLVIDSTDTNNALTGGKPEAFWERMYSQYRQIGQQNIERIVAKGNRMGDLTTPGNPIAEMALDDYIEGAPDLQVFGFASPMNTHFEYTPNELNLQYVPGQVNMNVERQQLEVNYIRGSIQVYMEQYPSVTVVPPRIDLTV
ncbi:DUF6470 family protein [Cohnella soli]|uniref:DUF6470 family protein n=1 Tax=Cohnella soli TaxID=425005 RepID=A0ABW0HL90_9BACL